MVANFPVPHPPKSDTRSSILVVDYRKRYVTCQLGQTSGPKYFRARFFDPSTGEFISRDPLEYVDGMSMYRGYFGLNNVDSRGTQCCLYFWDWDGNNVGHAALECSGVYMSFWPQPKPGEDVGLKWSGPCTTHTYAQDVAEEGGPGKKTCIPCQLDEAKIAKCWAKIVADCAAKKIEFSTCGSNAYNCSTVTTQLLKCGVPDCEKNCAPGADFVGCRDTCGGREDKGCPGLDRPHTAKKYVNCLIEKKCNPLVPNCLRCPK
jgi:RHS repeat-associated protein